MRVVGPARAHVFLLLQTACLAVFAVLGASHELLAAGQVSLAGGVFFEAEDFAERVQGPEFAKVSAEPLASGGQMLIGVFREGLVRYDLDIPQAGDHVLWLRCDAPSDTRIHIGVGPDGTKLTSATVAKTASDVGAATAYQWRRLGRFPLEAGKTAFWLGQGALRPDAFFFSRSTSLTATDALLDEVEEAKDAPRGVELPELVHERRITRHPQWLRQALRPCYAHFEWDPEMTAEAWSRRAVEAGANCLFGVGEMPAGTLHGKLKKFSYEEFNRNPTEFKFPAGYDLSYRWVKEFVDAAHSHDLKIVIYDGAFRSLDPLLVEHPEWRQKDSRGNFYRNGFGSWCSPYRKAYIQRWVEVAKLARFDGIMIDMLFTGPTGGDYSDDTVRAFKEKFGVEPPREADPRNLTYQRWLDFQAWIREEMLLDLTEALHAVDPEIAVIPNQTVGWIFQGRDHHFLSTRTPQCADGALEEMGWDFKLGAWQQRPWAWPAHSAWQNLFLHCRCRPGYGQMWQVDMNMPETHVQSLAFSMLANGTAPGVVLGGNWPQMSRVWQHTAACEPWITDASLVPWLAIHFGERSLDRHALARGTDTYMAHMKNLFGCFQAVLESHLPVEIITDDDLADPAVLSRYSVLLLANSACLSDCQAKAIADYVNGGGGLVASFETGCYDENGTRRKEPALRTLFGATQLRPVASANWSMPLGGVRHPILEHPDVVNAGTWRQGQSEPGNTATLFSGPAQRGVSAVLVRDVAADAVSVELRGAAIPTGRKTAEARPEKRTLLARSVGPGKVVYFPFDIGHAYYVFNHPVNRRLITGAIEWAASAASPLRTDAPMAVETVLWQKGEAVVVHLVNDISSFGRSAAPNPEAWTAFRAETLPVHDIRVAVRGQFREALLLPEGRRLEVTQQDGWSEAVVPRLDIHATVVFRP